MPPLFANPARFSPAENHLRRAIHHRPILQTRSQQEPRPLRAELTEVIPQHLQRPGREHRVEFLVPLPLIDPQLPVLALHIDRAATQPTLIQADEVITNLLITELVRREPVIAGQSDHRIDIRLMSSLRVTPKGQQPDVLGM